MRVVMVDQTTVTVDGAVRFCSPSRGNGLLRASCAGSLWSKETILSSRAYGTAVWNTLERKRTAYSSYCAGQWWRTSHVL